MTKYGFLEKMLDLLTSPYNRRDLQNVRHGREMETNIGRLFSLIAGGYELVCRNAELVRLWDDLEQAEGSVLDRYGANFGVVRGAASDPLYRIMIRVKMLAQLSGGDGDTVISAAAELLGVELANILLEDVYPAKIALYVDQLLLSEERLMLIEQIARAIKRILADGVGMRLYLRTYRTFRYDLPISHGGAVGTVFRYQPIGEDREMVWAVPVAHGGAVVTDFDYTPVGKDRAARTDFFVGHAGLVQPDFTPPPVSRDIAVPKPVFVAHSGHLPGHRRTRERPPEAVRTARAGRIRAPISNPGELNKKEENLWQNLKTAVTAV